MNDETTNFKWPRDGFVLVYAEGGKFFAATINPAFKEDLLLVGEDAKDDGDLFRQYIQPAITFLNQLSRDARRKALSVVCKQQVGKRYARLN